MVNLKQDHSCPKGQDDSYEVELSCGSQYVNVNFVEQWDSSRSHPIDLDLFIVRIVVKTLRYMIRILRFVLSP